MYININTEYILEMRHSSIMWIPRRKNIFLPQKWSSFRKVLDNLLAFGNRGGRGCQPKVKLFNFLDLFSFDDAAQRGLMSLSVCVCMCVLKFYPKQIKSDQK